MSEVIGIDFEILPPLVWHCALFKNGCHGAGRFAGSAIDTLVRVNIQLVMLFVIVFAGGGMDAINGTHIHTGAIFDTDTRLGNHVGHTHALLSTQKQIDW
jgi:hypothetical protein